MHPLLAAGLANSLSRDRVEPPARAAPPRSRSAPRRSAPAEVVIRRATTADAPALARLGELDGDRRAGALLARHAAEHDVLIAEVDGGLEAALALDDGLASPTPSARARSTRELLALRARQLGGAAPRDGHARVRACCSPRTS